VEGIPPVQVKVVAVVACKLGEVLVVGMVAAVAKMRPRVWNFIFARGRKGVCCVGSSLKLGGWSVEFELMEWANDKSAR